MDFELTVLFPLLGETIMLEEESRLLFRRIQELRSLPNGNLIEIIVIADGPSWFSLVNSWSKTNETLRIINSEKRLDNIAALLNMGAKIAKGKWSTFLWAGCSTALRKESWQELINKATKQSLAVCAGSQSIKEARKYSYQSWKLPQDWKCDRLSEDLLFLFDCIPMNNCVIFTKMLCNEISFDEDDEQVYKFWRVFILKASERGLDIVDVEAPVTKWTWDDFPYHANRIFQKKDLWFDSYARNDSQAISDSSLKDEANFDHALASNLDGLRVLFVHSNLNFVHLQLGFINYFELLNPRYKINWRCVEAESCTTSDILDADLVIFCRSINLQCLRLIKLCRKNSIPNLYMLDDNFFELGSMTYNYNKYIAEGSAHYESFLGCLREANSVITESPVLAKEIIKYRKNVFYLPTSINPSHFKSFEQKKVNGSSKKTIAYFGSERWQASAFEGMRMAIDADTNLRGVFLGSSSPPLALRDLPPDQFTSYEPVFNYKKYAAKVTAIKPDICIAPLGNSHFENSKCPLKHLEITACGAAGIYSDVPLYQNIVENGKNGILVDNDPRAWRDAILNLLCNEEWRKSIVKSAEQNMFAKYSAQANLHNFVRLITASVTGYDKKGISYFME
jgi:glycosyltransferase involved in cell wall biosynthesis